jgi:hypothetical protein
VLGVTVADVASAYLLGGDALDDLIGKQQELQDDADEAYRAALERNPNNILYGADTQRDLDEVNRLLNDQKKLQDEAAAAAQLAADAGLTAYQLKADLIGQVNDAYDEAAGSVTDYINTETGVFDTAAYITAMQQREQALRDYQTTLASVDLSPEAIKFITSQGQEAAASFLQGYKNATPAQRAELNRIWTAAGQDDSAAYSDTLATAFEGASVTGPEVELQEPNVGAVVSSIQSQLNGRRLTVRVTAVDQYGRPIY